MSTTIHDLQGSVIGYQDRDGTLRDKDNKKVGHINLRSGSVFDAQNEEVGFIDGDGNVIDRYRRRLGKIAPDGVVQDWHGIQVYEGSAAPLLLDFEGKQAPDPQAERLDFEQMARQAAATPSEFEREARKSPPRTSRQRVVGALTQEGFVSPSVVGCLAIVGALLIGAIILFLFQNPSFLPGGARATPTKSASTNATPLAGTKDATPNAEPTAAPAAKQVTGRVNTQILNLRSGPATSFEIVDRLQQDTEVVITGRLADSVWLKVTVPSIGKEGWVAAEYITTDTDIATLPVVQAPQ